MATPNNDPNARGSALYQYAVPAALFLVAAVTMAFYFRSRATSQAARERQLELQGGILVGVRGSDGELTKPVLVDAYLDSDALKHRQQEPWQWDEVMPLATMAISYNDTGASMPPKASSDAAHSAESTTAEFNLARVVLGMVILMPSPSPSNIIHDPDDEEPLPYLELGLVETAIAASRASMSTPAAVS
ncbi:hypothetical protein C8F01DRAFT_12372 [Mycena amicta]|nr:hypothetical protein C8F01DRAFT_12372 [Mycena amicta]